MISLASVVKLGIAFFQVFFRKWFVPYRPQLPLFVDNYERDGMLLFAEGDREVLDGASRCISCGRCELKALEDGTFSALSPRGPRAFVLGVSRHSSEHDEAELTDQATNEALEAYEAECPVSVPFVPLVALVRRRASALHERRSTERPERPSLQLND